MTTSTIAGSWLAVRPWLDRRGAFSPLKATTLLLLTLPALAGVVAYAGGMLGAEPVEALQDEAGLWALRFLFLALTVTPVRLLWRWNGLIRIRRMVGLAALTYALAHLWFYAVLQDWLLLKVALEIGSRVYLTIGAVALLGLVVLGLTSTDGMVRRLGAERWQGLHRLVYGLAVLATVHMFLQTRLDPTEAIVMSGLLGWLFAVRLWRWHFDTLSGPVALTLALVVVVATAFGEALFLPLRFGVDLATVLETNLLTAAGVRPAWWVAGLLLPLTLVALLRRRAQAPVRRRAG